MALERKDEAVLQVLFDLSILLFEVNKVGISLHMRLEETDFLMGGMLSPEVTEWLVGVLEDF